MNPSRSRRDTAPTIIARRFRQRWPARACLRPAEAEAIWRSRSAAFVDVLPRPPKPPNLPAGTVWRDKPRLEHSRQHLAAGHRLRNARGGDGGLSAQWPCPRLRRQSAQSCWSIYCLADCWMSWNAAKRALSYGYSNVAWYPEGTDGWQHADLPLAESQPEPGRRTPQ